MEFPPYVVIVRFYFYLYVEHGYIGCTDASDTNKDYATDVVQSVLFVNHVPIVIVRGKNKMKYVI